MTTGYLARARIGTAAVDLTLPQRVTAGTAAAATVELWGGTVAEVLAGLALDFSVARSASPRAARQVARVPIAGPFTIHAAEHRTVGTDIEIPHRLPATLGDTRVRLRISEPAAPEPADRSEDRRASAEPTHQPAEPSDHPAEPADQPTEPTPREEVATDGGGSTSSRSRWAGAGIAGAEGRSVEIRPGDRLAQVLDAVSALGFFLVSAGPIENDPEHSRDGQGPRPLQEIRFRPRWGPYADAGDLFLYPVPVADRLDVGVALAGSDHPRDGPPQPVQDRDRLTVRETGRRAVRRDLRSVLDRQEAGP